MRPHPRLRSRVAASAALRLAARSAPPTRKAGAAPFAATRSRRGGVASPIAGAGPGRAGR